ncbi:hypothetical protein VTL71DRAFT_11028 [Oculimacula yallundae]|uniref:C2H2-type domain-containing protein n=1 Tax=Oculimacula yallundae TaxID=86028 RepID=A0ABR4CV46_9HELO
MSSIKDIMDVDVEPFESQAYRRSKEAAQQQASRFPIALSTESPSSTVDDNNKGQSTVKRRRSDRVSRPDSQPPTAAQGKIRRRSSATGEPMDFTSGYQAGGSNQASNSGSPHQSPRGSEGAADMPVKYTPVTGRISRAKKGVPVHTCDICRPVKTFTRAEHLRRHQLSHQKPAYPCTFEDCERAFHRPDLLARHLQRHETQGEKPYKAGDPRSSRASSTDTESRTPDLKVETPATMGNTMQISPTDSLTPRTSGSGESSMTAASFNTITSSFQAVNFSPSSGHKRSASQAQLPDPEAYPGTSTGPSRQSGSFDTLSNGSNFTTNLQQAFGDPFIESGTAQFSNYTTTPQQPPLPLLRIPEENWIPGLSYNNSPWCSSASDSTYSARSELFPRDRSHSVATLADWPLSAGTHWSPHGLSTTPQEIRSPAGFDSGMERFESPFASPRMSSPSLSRGQLLDVPSTYPSFYMDTVGTPTLPTYISKPLAQHFPASPSRATNPGLDIHGGKKDLVESHNLGSFPLNATSAFQQSQLDIYISSYWQSFNSFFRILHRPTFNLKPNTLLTFAVAAIGTQYHDSPEARAKGVELNEYCKKNIELCLNWDLQTMQAILLTECFTRYRGRKTNVRLSRHFEELYSRLLDESDPNDRMISNQSPGDASSADALLGRFGPQVNFQAPKISSPNSEWYEWIEKESRQRLLSGCFIFDIHQSMYHQQPRSRATSNQSSSLFCQPCHDDLWTASNPSEWQAQRSDSDLLPTHLVEQDIASQAICSSWSFTQTLSICWFVSRLPPREDFTRPNEYLSNTMHPDIENFVDLFPATPLANSYMALYHTPLHSLLTVAGDTWVFAQKSPLGAFQASQSRLKTWSNSFAAAQATHHACKIISQALSQPITFASDGTMVPPVCCMTDYWSLYVSALICWAFGHRYQGSPANGTSGILTRSNSSTDMRALDTDDTPVSGDLRLKVLAYTNEISSLSAEELLTKKARMKGETAGIIDAVRQQLEVESVGNSCGMLLDALEVLKKLRKTASKTHWF